MYLTKFDSASYCLSILADRLLFRKPVYAAAFVAIALFHGHGRPVLAEVLIPKTVRLDIDWQSATQTFHQAGNGNAIEISNELLSEVSKSPVPVIFFVEDLSKSGQPRQSIFATDVGFVGSDRSNPDYNLHITGTNWIYAKKLSGEEIRARKNSDPVVAGIRDGGLSANFRKFGADYLVEVICADMGPCMTEGELLKITESLVVIGGEGINRY